MVIFVESDQTPKEMNPPDRNYKDDIRVLLTRDELFSVEKLLDRTPNDFELNMYAAMWSEHISYKSSTQLIEDFPSTGERVLVGAGSENAGVIDLGNELAAVVKLESHNHPTALDPSEAAVGVGNAFRDVIAMGAEPVAHLNIVRFGLLKDDSTRDALQKVVSLLGSYSNQFGVPVVGGEILFHESYAFNPLLNLMTIGIVRKDRLISAAFQKPGHKVWLVGKETSGTSVHGAGFASAAFTEKTRKLFPGGALADPQAGKVLFGFLSELNDHQMITSMQDIGAGGVLCAASEMAFRGGYGVEIELNEIPVSRKNMSPLEILLSQSQEQMLISVEEGHVPDLLEKARQWDITCALLGEVRPDNRIRVKFNGDVLGDLPVSSLVRGGGAPVYIRSMKDPGRKSVQVSAETVPIPGNLKNIARQMITLPNIASRKWIYEQFDTSAGLMHISDELASDSGILQIPGSDFCLAVSVDGNSRYVHMEPRKGGSIAVLEAARNIVCSGGKPVALVNGLNFGDPSDPEVYHDFVEVVKGIRQVATRMEIPVIGGNVSFNNLTQTDHQTVSVQPTPIIGMLGIIENRELITSISFRAKGKMIYLIGESDNDLSGSEYLVHFHLVEQSASPHLDLDRELKVQEVVGQLIQNKHIESAHDISLGGLFVALVECALTNNLGFDITSPAEVRTDAFLFNESQSRVIVSVDPNDETSFIDFMMESGVPFSALGHVTKEELRVDDTSYGFIADYARAFENALGNLLDESPEKK